MTNNFLQTVETIQPGRGFSLFSVTHLTWLAAFLLITVVNCCYYRRLSAIGRVKWKRSVAIALIADEIFKFIVLFIGGNFSWFYLPLHLCSINIFLILWHAISPSRHIGAFLYTVCIPGALAALLFPAWNTLPVSSAMHIHSFTAHILLALYPVVLTVAGEIRPTLRQLLPCLGMLSVLALLVYGVNLLLGTNFMFLMYAEVGNPLAWFYTHWGSHLWGFPVIAAGVIVVMYLPVIFSRKFNH